MDEIAKYKKRSKKKTPHKSDHKHQYENCVFGFKDYLDRQEFSIGTYCPICGKIGVVYDANWFSMIPYWPSREHWHDKWKEEIQAEFSPETRTLPYFDLHNIFQKNVIS